MKNYKLFQHCLTFKSMNNGLFICNIVSLYDKDALLSPHINMNMKINYKKIEWFLKYLSSFVVIGYSNV